MRLILACFAVFCAIYLILEPKAQPETLASFEEVLSASLSEANYRQQVECMATNIYHEARQESVLGQRAVAFVVLNRVASADFPSTVCDVVYQSEMVPHWKTKKPIPKRNRCQFSWYCDGKSDRIVNMPLYFQIEEIAKDVMKGYGEIYDPTLGSTYYHANYVSPNWRHLKRMVRIDQHIFYKEK